MSVFSEDDSKTIKTLGLTFAGFIGLTVFLVILAIGLT
jgi:hypothetical protein